MLKCGERLYPENVVKQFKDIRNKLRNDETKDFQVIGQAYGVSIVD